MLLRQFTLLLACVGQSRAGRYLLFTTQRSGSTWFCDVLSRQPGVECGVPRRDIHNLAEMMIHYSYCRPCANVTWEKWRADSDAQFAKLLLQNPDGKTAMGFKLMYDQVPPQLVGAFVRYVAEENISVVHLEREAVLLQVASAFQANKSKMHDLDAASAASTRASTPPLAIPFARAEEGIRARLAAHGAWKARLRYAPGVRYYHVGYEQLTGPAAENYLRSIIAFVLDPGMDIDLSSLSMASGLNMLHEASCRARIAPALYARLRESFGANSSVVAACNMLDARDDRLSA